MSILQFTPTQLFRDDSDSDSDSDCDDVTVQKSERQLRQLSILQKHDAAAYEAWVNVSHQYSLLLQQNHLNEIQIDNLTQQNQILIEMNIELKQKDAKLSHDLISVQDAFNGLLQENTRLVDQAFDYENETETLLGELQIIQQHLADGVKADTVILKIQEILTKDAIKKQGYV
jgi:hypothetical protein